MSVEGSVRAGASAAGKIYKVLWLITMIGFLVTIGGFYLEFRKLTGQVEKVQAMVSAIGEKVLGAAELKEKTEKQLGDLKEKASGLLDKVGK
jgi:hypothetical protein